MFKNVSIKNFRGFRELNLKNLGKLNVIVGGNNVGKTSLLEALYLAVNPGNIELPLKINTFRRFMHLNENAWLSFFNQFQADRSTSCEVIVSYSTKKKTDTKGVLKIMLFDDSEGKSLGIVKPSGSTSKSVKGIHTQYTQNGKRYEGYVVEQPQNTNSPVRAKNPEYESPFNGYFFSTAIPTPFMHELGRLVVEKKQNYIVDTLRKIDPNIQSLDVVGDSVFVDVGYEKKIPLQFLGGGINSACEILTYLYAVGDSGVLLIDEIDTGFHHKTLATLWMALLSALNDLNVQLFCTTHSYECLKVLVDTYSPQKHKNVPMQCIRLERTGDDITPVVIDYESLKTLTAAELEFR